MHEAPQCQNALGVENSGGASTHCIAWYCALPGCFPIQRRVASYIWQTIQDINDLFLQVLRCRRDASLLKRSLTNCVPNVIRSLLSLLRGTCQKLELGLEKTSLWRGCTQCWELDTTVASSICSVLSGPHSDQHRCMPVCSFFNWHDDSRALHSLFCFLVEQYQNTM